MASEIIGIIGDVVISVDTYTITVTNTATGQVSMADVGSLGFASTLAFKEAFMSVTQSLESAAQSAAVASSLSGALMYSSFLGALATGAFVAAEEHNVNGRSWDEAGAIGGLAAFGALLGAGLLGGGAGWLAGLALVKWTPNLGPGAKLELAVPSC